MRKLSELAKVLRTYADEQDHDGFYTFAATLREAAQALDSNQPAFTTPEERAAIYGTNEVDERAGDQDECDDFVS